LKLRGRFETIHRWVDKTISQQQQAADEDQNVPGSARVKAAHFPLRKRASHTRNAARILVRPAAFVFFWSSRFLQIAE
jgi:hypothetical protein